MKLREILSYIPKEQLRMFALEYQVDRQVKKLSGEVMFYLLLFSSLNVRHNSLRTLEQFYSCNQPLKMRNKETNRDWAEIFGNKWDGYR